MSKPTDIYKDFSRELLENFVWQLQCTRVYYEKALLNGIEQDGDCVLSYSFVCPSEEAAKSLESYINEQADDEFVVSLNEGAWLLTGRGEETIFDLGLILDWVGFMCDAGSQFGCRFDGWTVAIPPVTEEEPLLEEPTDTEAIDAAPEPSVDSYEHLVIARIMDPVGPLERGEKYEDPLTLALKEQGLGEVTGGGSLLNRQFEIEYVELEISLHDLSRGLELSKQLLKDLGAPKGSTLRFSQEIVIPISD